MSTNLVDQVDPGTGQQLHRAGHRGRHLCAALGDLDPGPPAVRTGHRGRHTPKTGGTRKIALDPETVAVLREHRRQQAAERLAYGPGWTDLGLVFVRADGTRIPPPQVGKAFNAHVARAGLRRIRLHDVRHSVASHLLARGVPITAVAGRLGHSVTTCERTYKHYIPSADAAAAAVMAQVMHR